jgi:hypothetical protein
MTTTIIFYQYKACTTEYFTYIRIKKYYTMAFVPCHNYSAINKTKWQYITTLLDIKWAWNEIMSPVKATIIARSRQKSQNLEFLLQKSVTNRQHIKDHQISLKCKQVSLSAVLIPPITFMANSYANTNHFKRMYTTWCSHISNNQQPCSEYVPWKESITETSPIYNANKCNYLLATVLLGTYKVAIKCGKIKKLTVVSVLFCYVTNNTQFKTKWLWWKIEHEDMILHSHLQGHTDRFNEYHPETVDVSHYYNSKLVNRFTAVRSKVLANHLQEIFQLT